MIQSVESNVKYYPEFCNILGCHPKAGLAKNNNRCYCYSPANCRWDTTCYFISHDGIIKWNYVENDEVTKLKLICLLAKLHSGSKKFEPKTNLGTES